MANIIYQNDDGTVFNLTIMDDSQVVDLTGATVEVVIKFRAWGVTKTAEIFDAINGKCRITLDSADIQWEGIYSFQSYVTFSEERSFSSDIHRFSVKKKIGYDSPPPFNGGGTVTTITDSTINGNIIVNGYELQVYDDTSLKADQHTHENKSDLDRLGLNENNKLTIDGVELVTGGQSTISDSSTNGNILVNGTEMTVYDDTSVKQDISTILSKEILDRLGISANGKLTIDGVEQSGGGGEEMTLVVKDYFEGSSNITKTYTDSMVGFDISNDHTTTGLTFTINGLTIPVKASETYSDNFEPFTSLTITSTVPYRATVKAPLNGTITPTPSDTVAPDNVTGLTTSNITHNSLSLTWNASASTDTNGYQIYQGSTLLTTVTGTTYNVTGLTESTSYTFTVKAKDSSNNVATGTSVTVSTIVAPDTTAPNNVANLTTSNVTTTSLTLSWTASTSSDVSGYDIYNGSTLLTTTSGTIYNVTGLTEKTSYTFTVKAKDSNNNIANGTSVNVTTVDATAPNNVTNLTTSNVSTSSLTLSWTASTSNDVSGYDVYNGSTLLTTVAGTTYNVSGLTANTNYTFTVKAKDASNNIASGTSVSVTTSNVADTTAPNDVTNLTTSNLSTTSVTLNWTASTSTDVASYEIYNGASLITSTASTSYTVTGLTQSTQYTLTVKAKDGAGNISTGTSVTFTTVTPDTTAPTVTALPNGGTFTSAQTVTLSANETATIYYTIDGSTPTEASAVYSSPITVSSTATLKFFGKDSVGNTSIVQTQTYTIDTNTSIIYLDNGYLTMPITQFTWGALTGHSSTNYFGMVSSIKVPTLFDQTYADSATMFVDGLNFTNYVTNMTGVEQEAYTIVTSGSAIGKPLLWLSKTRGSTAAELNTYINNSGKKVKFKLSANYKTLAISSNISSVTTRTSGVDTTKFEYFKCTLNDGIGTYTPLTTDTDKHFASNGYTVLMTTDYVFSRTFLNLRVNADSTLEMLLPKGTLSSIDVVGVSAYLANANLVVYYA